MDERVEKVTEAMEQFFILRRNSLRIQAAELGLYFGQAPILGYIFEHQGCTQKEIADALGITPASVAFSTKRMQNADLIQKQINAENMRCNKLSVTQKGRDILAAFSQDYAELQSDLFQNFSDEEITQFTVFLERLNQYYKETDSDMERPAE